MEQEIFGDFCTSKLADAIQLNGFNRSQNENLITGNFTSVSFPPINTVVGTITYPRFTSTLYIWKYNDFTLISLSEPIYDSSTNK